MHQRQLFLLLFLQQRPIRLHQQIGYFGEPLLYTYLNRKKSFEKSKYANVYFEIPVTTDMVTGQSRNMCRSFQPVTYGPAALLPPCARV